MADGHQIAKEPVQPPQIDDQAYFLGVDGGGSKTLAIIVDAAGQERGRGLAGSANYAVIGLDLAVQHIFQAVEQAKRSAGRALTLQNAWLGLAGIDRPADKDMLQPHLQTLAGQLHITNDAELGFSALDNAIGVVLIAGTGSIVLGRDSSGTIFRAGGWGHLLGDEGSGYDLGHQALLAVVRAADGRAPRTLLLELILKRWGLQKAEDILGPVYANDDKSAIATLSSCVFQAAKAGDEIAMQIIQRAADELVLTVNAVSSRLHLPELPLALAGGLLLNVEEYRNALLQRIERTHRLGQVVLVEEPAQSAARAAINLAKIHM